MISPVFTSGGANALSLYQHQQNLPGMPFGLFNPVVNPLSLLANQQVFIKHLLWTQELIPGSFETSIDEQAKNAQA